MRRKDVNIIASATTEEYEQARSDIQTLRNWYLILRTSRVDLLLASDPNTTDRTTSCSYEEKIGHGAVYSGQCDRVPRFMKPSPAGYTGIKAGIRECNRLVGVPANPHLPTRIGAYLMEDKYVCVTERYGPSLLDVLVEYPVLPPEQILHIMNNVATALKTIHDNHLVHREVHPGTIHFKELLYDPKRTNNDVILVDSGDMEHMFRDRSPTISDYNERYAPQSAVGDATQFTPSYDMWSLGCVLYELLGTTPMDSEFVRDLDAVFLKAIARYKTRMKGGSLDVQYHNMFLYLLRGMLVPDTTIYEHNFIAQDVLDFIAQCVLGEAYGNYYRDSVQTHSVYLPCTMEKYLLRFGGLQNNTWELVPPRKFKRNKLYIGYGQADFKSDIRLIVKFGDSLIPETESAYHNLADIFQYSTILPYDTKRFLQMYKMLFENGYSGSILLHMQSEPELGTAFVVLHYLWGINESCEKVNDMVLELLPNLQKQGCHIPRDPEWFTFVVGLCYKSSR
jgi:hypothetical protein